MGREERYFLRKMQKDLWARPQRIVRLTRQQKSHTKEIGTAASDRSVSGARHVRIQKRLRKSAYAYTHENLKKIGMHATSQRIIPGPDRALKIFATKTVKTIQYVIVSERPMTEGMVSVDIIAHRDSIGELL